MLADYETIEVGDLVQLVREPVNPQLKALCRAGAVGRLLWISDNGLPSHVVEFNRPGNTSVFGHHKFKLYPSDLRLADIEALSSERKPAPAVPEPLDELQALREAIETLKADSERYQHALERIRDFNSQSHRYTRTGAIEALVNIAFTALKGSQHG